MENQKSIFITGAGSGIGRATAVYFARQGWFVGLADRDEKAVSALAFEIGGAGVLGLACDVSDPASVAAAVGNFSEKTGGRMDVLFNCAGVLFMGRFEQVDFPLHLKTVSVNLVGILHGIHESLPLLRKTGGARIINMSSASAVYGTPELSVYAATKFAVRGLTEALNIEFEDMGIVVSDIMAPYVQTPMILDAPVQAASVEKLGVHLTPEDVAAVVWQAVHGRRVHWQVGGRFKLLYFFSALMPFANRWLIRRLAISSAR
jgi:NAD(P)-dependent dehydrogenase (short-subunit alcohol dehydrogenase family)